MKRLFVAIKIQAEEPLSEVFHELKQALKHEKIKWVEPHNLHLTLKFFGETSEEKIPDITDVLKKASKEHQAFSFDISKIGIFGSRYNPKIIWAGIEHTDQLIQLDLSIKNELKNIGFFPDRQNFVPHLTLGRIKFLNDKDLFQAIISDFREEYFQSVRVSEILLLESTLSKRGPVYSVIETFLLV